MSGLGALCLVAAVHVTAFGYIVRMGARPRKTFWWAPAVAFLPPLAVALQCWLDPGAKCSVFERQGSFTISSVVQRLPAYFFFAVACASYIVTAAALWWVRGLRVSAAIVLLSGLAFVGLPLRSGLEDAHNGALFALSGLLVLLTLWVSFDRVSLAHLAAAVAAGAVSTYLIWSESDARWSYFGGGAEAVAIGHAFALFV